MPTSLSAKKRLRQEKKRTQRNKAVKSQVKTSIRKFKKALENKNHDEVYPSLQEAVRTLDKAASKGVLHKNNAARKKSYLTNLYNDYQRKLG